MRVLNIFGMGSPVAAAAMRGPGYKQKGIKKYFSVPRIGDLTKDNYSEYFGSKSESEYIMKKGEDALEKLQQELETL